MQVLLFERDRAAARLLEVALRERGLAVTTTDEASQAWQLYQASQPRIVIVDWTAREAEGLCRRIRDAASALQPVILVSGLSDQPAELAAALRAGADDLLPKAADLGALAARLAVAEGEVDHRAARARAERELRELRETLADTARKSHEIRAGVHRALNGSGSLPAAAPQVLESLGTGLQAESARLWEIVGEHARCLAEWPRSDGLGGARSTSADPFRAALASDRPTFVSPAWWWPLTPCVGKAPWLVEVQPPAPGSEPSFAALLADVTASLAEHVLRRRAEQALSDSEERYALATRAANDGLWSWNLETDEISVSTRWRAMLGLEGEDLGRDASAWVGRIHPDDVERVRAKVAAHLAGRTPCLEDEHRLRHRDGSYRWVSVRGFAVRDSSGKPLRIDGAQTDVTDRRTYDPLTELPNRLLFEERLSQSIARARRGRDGYYAVLFIDLDRFKEVNDGHGHLLGDQLLVAVARRLESCLRPGDLVSRFGGDEFAILVDALGDAHDATRVARRIHEELAAPFRLQGNEVTVSASVGIALASPHYVAPAMVLQDADAAMYRAKAAGRGRFEVFDDVLRDRVMARIALEGELRVALERGQFRLLFQPVLELASRRVVALDVLLRWQHPKRGRLGPEEFLSVAEEAGLGAGLANWLLQNACRQLRGWRARLRPVSLPALCIIVSARMLAQSGFARNVAARLREGGLEASSLRFAVSEHAIAGDPDAAGVLCDLKQLGVSVEISAFATGLSSLPALERVRPDAVRVSAAWSGAADPRDGTRSLLRAALAIAEHLGAKVIADGVENARQVDELAALGCWAAQGPFLSAPVPASAIGLVSRAAGKANGRETPRRSRSTQVGGAA